MYSRKIKKPTGQEEIKMKTIKLNNGQVQTAEVTWEEFQNLDFKFNTANTLVCNATKETVGFLLNVISYTAKFYRYGIIHVRDF